MLVSRHSTPNFSHRKNLAEVATRMYVRTYVHWAILYSQETIGIVLLHGLPIHTHRHTDMLTDGLTDTTD